MNSKENNPTIQFERYKTALNKKDTLSLLFDIEACAYLMKEYCWNSHKDNLYTPTNTLLLFIKQVLSADKSCKNAVGGKVAQELFEKGAEISNSNSAYVKARQRLPTELPHRLMKTTGAEHLGQVPEEWNAFGRALKGFDGTTVTMSDTKANCLHYPKHSNQKGKVGFPLARLVVVMSLATGTILDYAIGPCEGKGTGESSLLRTLLPCLDPNDIVVADRYYPHFFLLCDLKKRNVDGLFRAAAQRQYDFRRGKRLGSMDHIATWDKPRKPDWMTKEEYNSYPDILQVREFKASGLVYVTTLLEPKTYSKKELLLVYKKRWQVETNLNYIKTIMEMNHLTCKSPDMIKKEITVHFLAYNLIRNLMVKAAMQYQLTAQQLSFKGTVQLLNQFTPFIDYTNSNKKSAFINALLHYISKNRVADRPGRIEIRAVKKRPKTFPVLKVDRKSLNRALAC